MLGKLLKHDFKATGKVMIPLNLILIAATLLGSLLLGSRLLSRTELLPLSIILLITYLLLLISLSVITAIYLVVYFYRNLFTAQGYLTFTLPASPWSLLHSKAIVGFAWQLLNSVLMFLSCALLLGSAMGFGNVLPTLQRFFTASSMLEINGQATTFSLSFWDMIGYSPLQLAGILAIMSLASCFYSVAVGYGSAAIGQLYARHKVVGTVLAYVVNYFVAQLLMCGGMLAFIIPAIFKTVGTASSMMTADDMAAFMRSIYQPMFPMLALIYLVLGIACYIAAGVIMKRKVNLD